MSILVNILGQDQLRTPAIWLLQTTRRHPEQYLRRQATKCHPHRPPNRRQADPSHLIRANPVHEAYQTTLIKGSLSPQERATGLEVIVVLRCSMMGKASMLQSHIPDSMHPVSNLVTADIMSTVITTGRHNTDNVNIPRHFSLCAAD